MKRFCYSECTFFILKVHFFIIVIIAYSAQIAGGTITISMPPSFLAPNLLSKFIHLQVAGQMTWTFWKVLSKPPCTEKGTHSHTAMVPATPFLKGGLDFSNVKKGGRLLNLKT